MHINTIILSIMTALAAGPDSDVPTADLVDADLNPGLLRALNEDAFRVLPHFR
jgi:hypothetical protein